MKCNHPSAEGTGERVDREKVYICDACRMRFFHRREDDGFDYLVELGRETNEPHL